MKELILAMTIAHGADIGTSLYGFHHGAVERNPFIISQKTAPFIGQATASTIGEIWLLKKIAKKHPKWAKGLAIAQIGASITAATLNARVIQEQKRLNRR